MQANVLATRNEEREKNMRLHWLMINISILNLKSNERNHTRKQQHSSTCIGHNFRYGINFKYFSSILAGRRLQCCSFVVSSHCLNLRWLVGLDFSQRSRNLLTASNECELLGSKMVVNTWQMHKPRDFTTFATQSNQRTQTQHIASQHCVRQRQLSK